MNDDGREATSLPRRALLSRAGRAGLGIAAGVPLASWLAACGGQSSATRRQTPTSAPTIAPTATSDTRPVTIAITGDLMLARSVGQRLLATSDTFPFTHTADFLRGFDLTVGNLECVVSTLGAPQPKQYTFEAPIKSFERLVAAGFDIVSLANNHSGDYGKAAFSDMLGKLPGYGLTPLGGGMNRAAAHTPVIRKVHGTTLGFLAYCEIQPQNFAATRYLARPRLARRGQYAHGHPGGASTGGLPDRLPALGRGVRDGRDEPPAGAGAGRHRRGSRSSRRRAPACHPAA